MTTIGRRTLLTFGALAAGATGLTFLLRRRERAELAALGPMVPDGARLLDLAAGFSYRIIDRVSEAMTDGYRVPGSPDGMACFSGANETLILLRNHELDIDAKQAAYVRPPPHAYDPTAFGAVTRVVLNGRTLEKMSSNLVLAGTLRNCGGGASPWGWLSAEESVARRHGYVFRCRPDASQLSPAERITAYGRFNHEAVCIDPRTSIAYLSEDQHDSCLYRFVPRHRDVPFEGKLQALRVKDQPRFDTGVALSETKRIDVDWVDVPHPDPDTDSVRYQAQERGAALVRRGEGIVFHEGGVYVCATIGGQTGAGQILRLTDGERPTLELVAESPGSEVLEMPDAIALTKEGNAFVAEDGLDDRQYVRVVTRAGRVLDLARNARSSGEFAGICFAPDGRTLFVNMLRDGVTLAVTGPFSALGALAGSA